MKLVVCVAAVTVLCTMCASALQKKEHGRALQSSCIHQYKACKAVCPQKRHHVKHVDSVKIKEEAELSAAKEKGKQEGHAEAQKLIPEGPHTETPRPSANKIPRSGEAKTQELELPEKIEGTDVTRAIESAEETLADLPAVGQVTFAKGEDHEGETSAAESRVLPKEDLADDKGDSSFLAKTTKQNEKS